MLKFLCLISAHLGPGGGSVEQAQPPRAAAQAGRKSKEAHRNGQASPQRPAAPGLGAQGQAGHAA